MIQRYGYGPLFMLADNEGEYCLYADAAPLEARIEELLGAAKADHERLVNAAEKSGIIFMGCDTPDAFADKTAEQAEEIERLKLEIERVANLGVNAVIKALDKTP